MYNTILNSLYILKIPHQKKKKEKKVHQAHTHYKSMKCVFIVSCFHVVFQTLTNLAQNGVSFSAIAFHQLLYHSPFSAGPPM